jgi:hypothetical protein
VSGPDDFDQIGKGPATPTDESLGRLEAQIARLLAQRGEERFMWSLVVLILVDFLFLSRLGNWGAALTILAVEAVLIVVLARKCSIPDVTMLLDRIAEFYGRSRNRRPTAGGQDC